MRLPQIEDLQKGDRVVWNGKTGGTVRGNYHGIVKIEWDDKQFSLTNHTAPWWKLITRKAVTHA